MGTAPISRERQRKTFFRIRLSVDMSDTYDEALRPPQGSAESSTRVLRRSPQWGRLKHKAPVHAVSGGRIDYDKEINCQLYLALFRLRL
jgi:hypothetical protein